MARGIKSHAAYVYVDAGYVRAKLRNVGLDDEFSPEPLWKLVIAVTADGQPIRPVRMFFYDAVDETAPESEKVKLQAYLEKVERLAYVSVATGFLRPGKKRPRQQKGVDVQIAVDALEAASTGKAEAICLIAGDADFCPLAEAVRRAGVFMLVYGFRSSLSQELQRSADVAKFLPDPADGAFVPF